MGSRKVSIPDTPPSEVQLIALQQLAERDDADPVQAERTALNIASNRLARASDRVKAIELCTRLKSTSALPLFREIMTSEKADVSIRTSAITAVAALGDQTDEPALQQLASSKDDRVRAAAVDALSRIRRQG
ncbi:MAG: HEAT repeat domain-containing protein [Kiritimatiellae bacterium]|nr:HEAT repeat domain-containing protein [Kiritimatiellia bacterium]